MCIRNLIILSSILTPERYEEIRTDSKGAMSNANSTFQKAIIKGLQENNQCVLNKMYIINAPNIGAFPFKYKRPFFKKSKFSLFTIDGINVPFCNLPRLKHYSIYYSVRKELNHAIKLLGDDIFVLIYGLYTPFLHAVNSLKSKYRIKTCLVVPDLPGFTGRVDHWAYKFFQSDVSITQIHNALKAIDSYVLLTETMRELLPINDKKYIVIEGILYDKMEKVQCNKFKEKVVLYSGALDERNGVLQLLNAFELIEDSSFRLMICGDGELKDTVERYRAMDSRIIYKGQLPHKSVLELQAKATLLVNPRMPIDEFTKYSFPSKTIEYLASGTPLLMYKLPTLPIEYNPYCYFVPDNDLASLSKKIKEICLMPDMELTKKSENARTFILNNKTTGKQVKKILTLLNSI